MAVAALDIDEAAAQATATSLADEFGVPTTAVAHRRRRRRLGRGRRQARRSTPWEGATCSAPTSGVQQFGAIDRLTEEDWSWVLNVNVMGTVRTVREFLPLLRAGAGWRQIVLTASSGVLVPGVRLGAYQTSKFAVMGFGETLRQELAGEGIGVSILFPGGHDDPPPREQRAGPPGRARRVGTLPDDIEAMLASRQHGRRRRRDARARRPQPARRPRWPTSRTCSRTAPTARSTTGGATPWKPRSTGWRS